MLLQAILATCVALVSAENTRYSVPPEALPGSGVLDSGPVSISFEFFQFPKYFVNVTNTEPCLHNLKRLTGNWPKIRIGGTSQDYATFNETFLSYITYSEPPKNVAAQNITIGPSYIQLAANYPGKVVYGLNRGSNNMQNTLKVAKYAEKILKNLDRLELGNEPVMYPYVGNMSIAPPRANASLWTPKTEAESEDLWQRSIASQLKTKKVIQAGNYIFSPPVWGAASLIQYMNPETIRNYTKVFSHHNYRFGAEKQNLPPTAAKLMNHTEVALDVARFVTDVQAAKKIGYEYVLGETNSVSGGGAGEVSPTFAAALWLLDYSLQAASINISNLYFHQGTVDENPYAWWDSVGVSASYYGAYAATAALAGGKYISPIDKGDTRYSGYVIYSVSRKPIRVMLYNSDYFNGTGTRTSEDFVLSGLSCSRTTVRRLTAPNALSRQDAGQNPTFAGMEFANATCALTGKEQKEVVKVSRGSATYTVKASEAILIDL